MLDLNGRGCQVWGNMLLCLSGGIDFLSYLRGWVSVCEVGRRYLLSGEQEVVVVGSELEIVSGEMTGSGGIGPDGGRLGGAPRDAERACIAGRGLFTSAICLDRRSVLLKTAPLVSTRSTPSDTDLMAPPNLGSGRGNKGL